MNEDIESQGPDVMGEILNTVNPNDRVVIERDALTLDGDDIDFITTARELIQGSQSFYKGKYHLAERQEQNEKYTWGRQLDDVRLKKYQSDFVDNILYDSMSYTKPLALSRMPDVTVKAAQDTDVSKAYASDLSKITSSNIQSRERKYVLGMAYKHRPMYFYGVVKAFWNPEKGKNGDYDFKFVHPQLIVMDHTSQTSRSEDMDFVAESVEYTVKEWVMRFPKKEKDFYQELRNHAVFTDVKNEKNAEGMNTKVKGWEIWFTWYQKLGEEYQKLECVAWFYEKLLFDKMKNPYWDWQGEQQTFRYDKIATEEDFRQAITAGDMNGFKSKDVFHNHHPFPKKPYIFLTYDQWGKVPIDETSEIEQSIKLQKDYDKRGGQITEMLDRSRGKHVFSADGGLEAKDIEEMDMSDPSEDILIKGEVQKMHAFIPGEQPSPAMIESYKDNRERIFSKMGANAATRGQVDSEAPATSAQLGREGDFSRNDDVTDDTINYAAEEMANWELQFIKLFYTEEHFVSILGEDGSTLFKKAHRDMVQDGMEVTISASGADKLKREQQAMDMAKLKMIDPYNFYKDLEIPDPKGRTEMLMLFMMQPQMYIQKYINGNANAYNLTTALTALQNGQSTQMNNGVGAQNAVPQPAAPQAGATPPDPNNPNAGEMPQQGSPQALQDIMQIQQGQVPTVPNQIDPNYMQTIVQFVNSPAFEQVLQQFPGIKEQIIQWLRQVQALAQQSGQGGGQPQPQPTPNPASQPTPPTGGGANPSVGPMTGNPQPGNTSKIATTPSMK